MKKKYTKINYLDKLREEILSEHSNWTKENKKRNFPEDENQNSNTNLSFSNFFFPKKANNTIINQNSNEEILKKIPGLYLYGQPGLTIINQLKIK